MHMYRAAFFSRNQLELEARPKVNQRPRNCSERPPPSWPGPSRANGGPVARRAPTLSMPAIRPPPPRRSDPPPAPPRPTPSALRQPARPWNRRQRAPDPCFGGSAWAPRPLVGCWASVTFGGGGRGGVPCPRAVPERERAGGGVCAGRGPTRTRASGAIRAPPRASSRLRARARRCVPGPRCRPCAFPPGVMSSGV